MPTPVTWQKSSFSSEGSACLELARSARGDAVLLRESDDPLTILTTTPVRLNGLIAMARSHALTAP
jgi:hypothetical protein